MSKNKNKNITHKNPYLSTFFLRLKNKKAKILDKLFCSCILPSGNDERARGDYASVPFHLGSCGGALTREPKYEGAQD